LQVYEIFGDAYFSVCKSIPIATLLNALPTFCFDHAKNKMAAMKAFTGSNNNPKQTT
jgi:hypothetical protein